MKVVILAGGYGTRISEETHLKPKPMIEIGDRPILIHLMEHYSLYGFDEFVICLGYKGYAIKEYFANYYLQAADVTFDFSANGEVVLHNRRHRPWKVTLAETGKDTMTGGRIKRIEKYAGGQPFMLTYGDGIANVDLDALLGFHRSHGKWATVTAVQPAGRFGAIRLDGDREVAGFEEKPLGDGNWVNGGFFVLEPQVRSRCGAWPRRAS
jgi:glucose-1-phosphate cytidylyltransferase